MIARILVIDDADLSTAAAYGRALSVRPFSAAGEYSMQHCEHCGLLKSNFGSSFLEGAQIARETVSVVELFFQLSSFWLVRGPYFLALQMVLSIVAACMSEIHRIAVWI